jgi:hypothetical protein
MPADLTKPQFIRGDEDFKEHFVARLRLESRIPFQISCVIFFWN